MNAEQSNPDPNYFPVNPSFILSLIYFVLTISFQITLLIKVGGFKNLDKMAVFLMFTYFFIMCVNNVFNIIA